VLAVAEGASMVVVDEVVAASGSARAAAIIARVKIVYEEMECIAEACLSGNLSLVMQPVPRPLVPPFYTNSVFRFQLSSTCPHAPSFPQTAMTSRASAFARLA